MTTGGYHTCALTSAGAAYCWGYNADGAVGDGSFTDRLTPVLVSGALTFQSISAGEFHTCGITTTTNVLYCWGYNFWGQIGNGAFSNRNTPTAVGGLIAFQAVAAGALHTCGYSTSGSGYCWGNNERGQLGYGTRVIRTTPAAVVTGPAAAPPLFTGGYSEMDWMRSGEHLRAAPRWGEPAVAGKLEPHRPRSADR
ncbi:MAG: hypothetical protein HY560_09195 [Gemmatimonadetes bacterium]|nr:hypothetical protein [Gemmatimonadota bacterium]